MNFIDSNLWIYLFPKQDISKFAVVLELTKQNNIVISQQVINEVCCVLLAKLKASEHQIKEIILGFSLLNIHPVTLEIINKASDLRTKYQFRYWDSLLVATALDVGGFA